MIKDLIRLKWHAKLSHADTAATLNVSKGVVSKYVALATAAGLDWDAAQDMSEQQLAAALQPRSLGAAAFIEPDWAHIHRELAKKGMTLMLLWQEYTAEHAQGRTWRYTQFCEHYKAFAGRLERLDAHIDSEDGREPWWGCAEIRSKMTHKPKSN